MILESLDRRGLNGFDEFRRDRGLDEYSWYLPLDYERGEVLNILCPRLRHCAYTLEPSDLKTILPAEIIKRVVRRDQDPLVLGKESGL